MENDLKLRNMTAVYLHRNGKLLMLYRQGSKVADNLWIGSAGGHFEPSELNDPKACILRELWEELSVTEEMLSDLRLRYVTLRGTKEEIRQNYYFFAELKEDPPLISTEGILRWFAPAELSDLEMPFTAKFVLEHYLRTGQYDDRIYAGVSDGVQVVFTQLPQF